MKTLQLKPLNAPAFEAFGQVLEKNSPCEQRSINDGLTVRHHSLSTIDCNQLGGQTIASIFSAQAITDDFLLTKMERHPLGSQSFINISGNPYVVVVAPRGDLDENAIRGFYAQAHQSVTYNIGTWHHFLLALAGPSDFVVIDRDGPGDNCDEQTLATPLRLELPA